VPVALSPKTRLVRVRLLSKLTVRSAVMLVVKLAVDPGPSAMVLLTQFELVLQRPSVLTFHVPSSAWSAGASRMKQAAIEAEIRLDRLFTD